MDEKPAFAPLQLTDPKQRPSLDGALDEPVWQQAAAITELRQVEPREGGEPSERTEVRILYDDRTLFVGVLCRDRDPSTIRATQMQRDANLQPDDSIALLLDTFHDRRNAFYFQIGAAGGLTDALVAKNGAEFNLEWDGIWDARARVTSEGWVAEIEIPFETLNFREGETTWGFNVQRVIRRGHEILRWASPSPRFDFDHVAEAGTLVGLDGMRQSLGLDVVPFGVASHVHDRTNDRDYSRGEVGSDLYWRLTPNLKLSLSVNTDFAETEVDDRRVNLTRFPLFFPEKRRFFLEDANNFVFANGEDAEVLPYFSRRIGRSASGEEVPILAAAKFTGRTDDFSLGLQDVQTDAHHDVDSQNLLVARYEQNLFEQSTAGVIFTQGDPTGERNSVTYGADFNYRTDSFLGDRNLRFGTWYLRSDTSGVDGRDEAWNAHVAYPNDEVEAGFDFTLVGEQFDPLLGFVERTGIKQYTAQAAFNPRLTGTVRQLFFEVEPRLVTDMSNRMETSEIDVTPIGLETQEGDEAGLRIRRVYDRIEDDFEIVDGVIIPADAYRFTRYGAVIESSSGRPFTLESSLFFGPFYGGSEVAWTAGLTVRPDRHVNATIEYEQDDGDLPGGDFVVRVTRLRVNLLFSPRLVWSNFVQHDNVSDALALNSRLRWILTPGSDFFLVLNEGWFWSPDRFAATDTRVALKLGYTFRF